MPKPLTIIVGGYIVGFPLGGMTWHHLNYLLGLTTLGHEVWFLEDSGDNLLPYNPKTWMTEPDSTYGREYLENTFAAYGLKKQYCYYSQFEDRHYGLSKNELSALLNRADLFIAVSGITPLRDHRPRPKRSIVIDTDPVFTQLRMRNDPNFVDYYRQFDRVATFGKLIGTADCPIPTHGFDWVRTQQPISLPHWPVVETTSRRFTTIGKWEHASERHLEFNGQTFRSSKGVEWEKVRTIPERVPFEMAMGMSSMQGDDRKRFEEAGWALPDAEAASISACSYQDFIQQSAGEFTVAKEIYAGLPSGWFSDRSAAYLASGRPVVTQASGFDQWLPTGCGLFSYSTADEAVAALRRISDDWKCHAVRARQIAREFFDAEKVLSDLIDRAMG